MICRLVDLCLQNKVHSIAENGRCGGLPHFGINALLQRVKPVGVAGELDFPGGNGFDFVNRQRRGEGEVVHGAMRQQGVAISVIGRRIAADGQRIEAEIIRAVGGNDWQRRENLPVRVNRAADAGLARAVDEDDAVGHAVGQRLAGIVGEIKIVVRIHQRGVNGRAVAVRPVGKIIEFKQVGGNAVGAGKIGAGGVGEVAQPDRQLKISRDVGVGQVQIEQDTEAVRLREGRAKRMIKIAVGLRRIPGDG